MGLIAVDVAGIEIGAAFALMIVIAVVAFSVHSRLLKRDVQRCLADLRGERARAGAASLLDANHPHSQLRVTTPQEHWVESRRAANANKRRRPAPRAAAPTEDRRLVSVNATRRATKRVVS